MADQLYDIPENPEYNAQIRRLKKTDPANADTVFNPLFQHIISNIHAVKLETDNKVDKIAEHTLLSPKDKEKLDNLPPDASSVHIAAKDNPPDMQDMDLCFLASHTYSGETPILNSKGEILYQFYHDTGNQLFPEIPQNSGNERYNHYIILKFTDRVTLLAAQTDSVSYLLYQNTSCLYLRSGYFDCNLEGDVWGKWSYHGSPTNYYISVFGTISPHFLFYTNLPITHNENNTIWRAQSLSPTIAYSRQSTAVIDQLLYKDRSDATHPYNFQVIAENVRTSDGSHAQEKFDNLSSVAFSGSYTDLSDQPDNATVAKAGFLSATDKVKLDHLQGAVSVREYDDAAEELQNHDIRFDVESYQQPVLDAIGRPMYRYGDLQLSEPDLSTVPAGNHILVVQGDTQNPHFFVSGSNIVYSEYYGYLMITSPYIIYNYDTDASDWILYDSNPRDGEATGFSMIPESDSAYAYAYNSKPIYKENDSTSLHRAQDANPLQPVTETMYTARQMTYKKEAMETTCPFSVQAKFVYLSDGRTLEDVISGGGSTPTPEEWDGAWVPAINTGNGVIAEIKDAVYRVDSASNMVTVQALFRVTPDWKSHEIVPIKIAGLPHPCAAETYLAVGLGWEYRINDVAIEYPVFWEIKAGESEMKMVTKLNDVYVDLKNATVFDSTQWMLVSVTYKKGS